MQIWRPRTKKKCCADKGIKLLNTSLLHRQFSEADIWHSQASFITNHTPTSKQLRLQCKVQASLSFLLGMLTWRSSRWPATPSFNPPSCSPSFLTILSPHPTRCTTRRLCAWVYKTIRSRMTLTKFPTDTRYYYYTTLFIQTSLSDKSVDKRQWNETEHQRLSRSLSLRMWKLHLKSI